MIVTHQVTIDLLERKSVPQIEASQNDRYTREVAVHLFSGEESWNIPQDISVVIRYCCSDGSAGEYDALPDESPCWKAEDNILTLQLAPQVLSVAGTTVLAATMYRQQKAISVFSIGILVHPTIEGNASDSPYCNVTGFLPAPDSAEAGQYVRITEVDESGHVLAVEAVDLATLGDMEPWDEDIPYVFFGKSLPQTKDRILMPFRYVSKTQDISCWCSAEAQGDTSMNFPKKNQTVELYGNLLGREKRKMEFRNWGEQSKFCFKANWTDLTHARNVVSARLWGDVVRSRDNYMEMPELYRASPNQGAVDGFPVKVFADGVYQGRYTLNIPKDVWMAGMDRNQDNHCILCGENFESGCFRAEAQIDGSDWSDVVHNTVPEGIRNRWNQVISFVHNSTDEEFRESIGDYFYLDSLIDYHLFGLLSCGLDTYGKNQLYMTYDGQKWIAGMYDLDATWGLWWDGAAFVAKDYDRSQYRDFREGSGNLLYIRLEQCFPEEIRARWEQLRSSALSVNNILLRFERFIGVMPEELVKEDYAVTTGNGEYTGIPLKASNNIQQIRSFVVYRHGWCDAYVNALMPENVVKCTGITFGNDAFAVTVGQKFNLPYTVTPESCTESIQWTSSDNSILTVEEGVINAVAAGDAVVTAVCGDYWDTVDIMVLSGPYGVSCSGITLSESSVTLSGAVKHRLTASLVPEDCTDPVVWESGNTGVATVSDGVVQAVGDGQTTITATCGSVSARCIVSVEGMSDNILAGISWHPGTVSETTGQIESTDLDGYYTDPIPVSEFAGTILHTACDGCDSISSGVAVYNGNMELLSYFQVNGCELIPVDAAFVRLRISNGTGKMLEIRGSRENFWNVKEVNEGSYGYDGYHSDDTASCHIRVEAAPEEVLATYGAWGVAFLDGEDEILSVNALSGMECETVTAPDGTEIAAVCAYDSNQNNCVFNRLQTIGYGSIG